MTPKKSALEVEVTTGSKTNNNLGLKSLGTVLTTAILFATAFANAADNLSQRISRSASSGLSVQTELSKDLLRQEAYQANYTVDVPYQEQEDYYESVPYTVTVPYTEYETYYEDEYQCRPVTRYREECRDERVCRPTPGQCHEVTECEPGPRGTKFCRNRQVCDSSGGQDCHNEHQCRQVPFTDQICHNERVAKTRPVTRYREETRYRQERRTRTVTRTRQETRCCVTRYRDVFDHTETLPVLVRFPAGSELVEGEVESMVISSASRDSLQAQLQFVNSIFAYSIASVTQEGRTTVFTLTAAPRLNAGNAAESSISNLRLSFSAAQAFVSFTDSVQMARVQTLAHLTVQNKLTQEVVFDQDLTNNANKALVGALDRSGKFLVTLKVTRTGANVAGGKIEFVVSSSYEKRELDSAEIASLQDKALVVLNEVSGKGASAVLKFEDRTLVTEDVSSSYKIVVWKREGSDLKWLGEKTVARESLQGSDNQVALSSLGLSAALLNQKVTSGSRIYFDIVVNRSSAKYLQGRSVQFISSKTLDVK